MNRLIVVGLRVVEGIFVGVGDGLVVVGVRLFGDRARWERSLCLVGFGLVYCPT